MKSERVSFFVHALISEKLNRQFLVRDAVSGKITRFFFFLSYNVPRASEDTAV